MSTTEAPAAPMLPEGRTKAEFERELRALQRTGSVLSDAFLETAGLPAPGPRESGKPKRGAPKRLTLAVSFQQVVHPVLSEEAGVAKLQRFLGGPDEHP
jgi:hypothetical protein